MVARTMLSDERIPVKKRKARIGGVSPVAEEGEGDLIIDETPIESRDTAYRIPEPSTLNRNTVVATSISPQSSTSRGGDRDVADNARSTSPKSPSSNNSAGGWNRNRNAEKAHRARENTKFCMGMVRGHLQEMKDSMQTSMDQLLQHLPMRTDMTVLNLIEKFRDSRRGEVVSDSLIQSRSSAATILGLSTQTTDMFRWYVGLVSEVLKGVEENKQRITELEKKVREEEAGPAIGRGFYHGQHGNSDQGSRNAVQSNSRPSSAPSASKSQSPPCCCGTDDGCSKSVKPVRSKQFMDVQEHKTLEAMETEDPGTSSERRPYWRVLMPTNRDRREWVTDDEYYKSGFFKPHGLKSPNAFESGFVSGNHRSNDFEEEMKIGRHGLVGGSVFEVSAPMAAKRFKVEEPIDKNVELRDLVATFANYQARLKNVFDLAVSKIPLDSN